MQKSCSFKQSLLKHMLVGLQAVCANTSKMMSLMERKEAVMLSANVAMVIARGGTRWSRAVIADLSRQEKNRFLLKTMFSENLERFSKQCHQPTCKVLKSNKILRRSFRGQDRRRKAALSMPPRSLPARCLARRILKKRIQVLKRLVPGGATMNDELSFLGETIDYIVSVRAQVDMMRRLAKSVDILDTRSFGPNALQENVGNKSIY